MKKIKLPMKVHAVKLEYRRRLLMTIKHGYFSVRRGKTVVVITYDPDDKLCSPKKPHIYNVFSMRGKALSEEITNYLKIKDEFEILLNDWKSLYRVAPPSVKLQKTPAYDPHKMDNKFYESQKDNLGSYTPKNPTVSDLGVFKSKNELIAADTLHQMGIPFKYETEIYIEEAEEFINPDFLVNFYEIDRCLYLEVLGMNDKFSYAASTSVKITSYSKGKYRPGKDVIYIHLYDKSNFDKGYFIEQVLSAFNSLIPDSALDWGDVNGLNSFSLFEDEENIE